MLLRGRANALILRPMPAAHVLAWILTVLFAAGVAGCALVIPLAAWKFFSVLLEKGTPEDEQSRYVQLQ